MKIKTIVLVLLLELLLGVTGLCQQNSNQTKNQPTEDQLEVEHSRVQRINLLAHMHRILRHAGVDSDEIKIQVSFFETRGVLAIPSYYGFQYLGIKPSDGKYFTVCFVTDSNRGGLQTADTSSLNEPYYDYGRAVLFVPEKGFDSSWQLIAILKQVYFAYIYLGPHPYDEARPGYMENERTANEFLGKVLKAEFGTLYATELRNLSDTYAALIRGKKKKVGEYFPSIGYAETSDAIVFEKMHKAQSEQEKKFRVWTLGVLANFAVIDRQIIDDKNGTIKNDQKIKFLNEIMKKSPPH